MPNLKLSIATFLVYSLLSVCPIYAGLDDINNDSQSVIFSYLGTDSGLQLVNKNLNQVFVENNGISITSKELLEASHSRQKERLLLKKVKNISKIILLIEGGKSVDLSSVGVRKILTNIFTQSEKELKVIGFDKKVKFFGQNNGELIRVKSLEIEDLKSETCPDIFQVFRPTQALILDAPLDQVNKIIQYIYGNYPIDSHINLSISHRREGNSTHSLNFISTNSHHKEIPFSKINIDAKLFPIFPNEDSLFWGTLSIQLNAFTNYMSTAHAEQLLIRMESLFQAAFSEKSKLEELKLSIHDFKGQDHIHQLVRTLDRYSHTDRKLSFIPVNFSETLFDLFNDGIDPPLTQKSKTAKLLLTGIYQGKVTLAARSLPSSYFSLDIDDLNLYLASRMPSSVWELNALVADLIDTQSIANDSRFSLENRKLMTGQFLMSHFLKSVDGKKKKRSDESNSTGKRYVFKAEIHENEIDQLLDYAKEYWGTFKLKAQWMELFDRMIQVLSQPEVAKGMSSRTSILTKIIGFIESHSQKVGVSCLKNKTDLERLGQNYKNDVEQLVRVLKLYLNNPDNKGFDSWNYPLLDQVIARLSSKEAKILYQSALDATKELKISDSTKTALRTRAIEGIGLVDENLEIRVDWQALVCFDILEKQLFFSTAEWRQVFPANFRFAFLDLNPSASFYLSKSTRNFSLILARLIKSAENSELNREELVKEFQFFLNNLYRVEQDKKFFENFTRLAGCPNRFSELNLNMREMIDIRYNAVSTPESGSVSFMLPDFDAYLKVRQYILCQKILSRLDQSLEIIDSLAHLSEITVPNKTASSSYWQKELISTISDSTLPSNNRLKIALEMKRKISSRLSAGDLNLVNQVIDSTTQEVAHVHSSASDQTLSRPVKRMREDPRVAHALGISKLRRFYEEQGTYEIRINDEYEGNSFFHSLLEALMSSKDFQPILGRISREMMGRTGIDYELTADDLFQYFSRETALEPGEERDEPYELEQGVEPEENAFFRDLEDLLGVQLVLHRWDGVREHRVDSRGNRVDQTVQRARIHLVRRMGPNGVHYDALIPLEKDLDLTPSEGKDSDDAMETRSFGAESFDAGSFEDESFINWDF